MWKLIVVMRAFHPQGTESHAYIFEFSKQQSANDAANFLVGLNGASYDIKVAVIHDQ